MTAAPSFLYLFALAFILLMAVKATAQIKNPVSKKNSNSYRSYSYQIINSPEKTFGYDILQSDHVVIHQPYIPAVPGNNGFTKRLDADKTAKLVLIKLSHNIMPPTISIHELDSLNIHIFNKKNKNK